MKAFILETSLYSISRTFELKDISIRRDERRVLTSLPTLELEREEIEDTIVVA